MSDENLTLYASQSSVHFYRARYSREAIFCIEASYARATHFLQRHAVLIALHVHLLRVSVQTEKVAPCLKIPMNDDITKEFSLHIFDSFLTNNDILSCLRGDPYDSLGSEGAAACIDQGISTAPVYRVATFQVQSSSRHIRVRGVCAVGTCS